MENIKEIILYSENFKANDKLISFAKELGFNNIKDVNCRMDKKFIDFIKMHCEKNKTIINNKEINNVNKTIGHNGFAYINKINTSKKWAIIHDSRKDFCEHSSFEQIAYLQEYHQKNNLIEISII